MRILRAADRAAVAWKNGGGITREVAVSPQGAGLDDFDWRVSIAQVSEPGPFSIFPGIDRTLAILDGRMMLAFDAHSVTLDAASAPFAFAGDVACTGTPLDGAVTDLNVMTRRGRCSAGMERMRRGFAANALVVALATTRLGDETLRRFDAALVEHVAALGGDAYVIAIT